MKVCVTGASGFVGQNLTKYLNKEGFQVEAISLRNHWELPNDADAIIHLAGIAHDTSKTSSESEYFTVNRDLTAKLFDEFLKNDIKKFFYFSSVKATADTIEGFLDENHHSNPITPYGKSKLEAENYLLKQKLADHKRLFIIRPCMIHGPGNKGNLNLLSKVVEKGVPWPLAAFENNRSYLSIDNLNFLIKKMLLEPNLQSGIYNFADDDAVSTNQLIKIIADANYKNTRLIFISPKFIKLLAAAGDFIKFPLNSERLKKLTESYLVSNQKIKNALRIKTLPLSAQEGLVKTIKSFKKSQQ